MYEVANCERTPDWKFILNPRSEFKLKVLEVGEPVWFAAGSGYLGISKRNRQRLFQSLVMKPRTIQDHQRLLAGVNRQVGRDPKYRVSPWCQTGFIPPSGIGTDGMDHRKPDEPVFDPERPTPMLFWGIDFTDTASGLAQMVRLMHEGHGPGDPVFEAAKSAQEGAAKRGMRPRP